MADFFDDFDTESFPLYSKDTNSSLVFSVYKGNLSFTIWPPKDSGSNQPLYKKSISRDIQTLFNNCLKKIIPAPPNTKETIVIQLWNKDQKTYKKDCVIILEKDDMKTITLAVDYVKKDRANKEIFQMLSTKSISLNSELMDDSARSETKVRSLIAYLTETVPQIKVLTNRKYRPARRQQPTTNNNNNNRNNSGGNNNSSEFDF